ncbi:MAG: radical SAM protein [Clostridiales bacterium]|nr:radical SAM protein [Clostridiales bacterium]
MGCEICPRNCNVNRNSVAGFCNSTCLKINKAMIHFWEEPIISGENGSGTIFFSGCNLKCIYCQNYEISSLNNGINITINQLVDIIKKLEEKNVTNINFVTPTHFTDEIISALKIYKPKVPVVWNTSGYEKPETIEKLKNYVDIFLFDLKYYDEKLSLEYSKAKDYFKYASNSLIKVREIIPLDIIENNIMKKGIIVRHLVLPNTTNDSIKIIDFINEKLGNKTIVSLLNQYTPYYKALNHPILKRKVKDIEYKRVVKHLINLNFENAYLQDKDASNECFIPNFEEEFNITKFLND